MSVKVEDLTKIYGEQYAVNNVSFEAKKGEVLGFLGPNGAGKTTTMKVITCFIPQNEGSVTVSGFDTASQPMEVRERIGYLPEHNPLYKDMYVKEYLNFVAGLHDISDKKKRVAEMVELTGLGDEQAKQIGALSKGYRQRVGLAQAMIHDPEVLILDEPTSGLDPNQLVDIRALITDFGKEKTVIFSTHIMQEVQAICDRVLIINKGKIVANDSIERLQQRVRGGTLITVQFLEKINEKHLKGIPGVKSVEYAGDNLWQLSSNSKNDIRSVIFNYAVKKGWTLLEMRKEVFSIESVFQQLTKEK
ncbi:MAG: gliding motility-associated ABC transporter ATP-binding subunit GldA [Bacteroidota bacterium]